MTGAIRENIEICIVRRHTDSRSLDRPPRRLIHAVCSCVNSVCTSPSLSFIATKASALLASASETATEWRGLVGKAG